MISFSYTGAKISQQPQSNPQKSLGGYISSSPIINGFEGNLFPSTSLRNLEKGSFDTRCMALKNIGETNITSLVISLDNETELDSIISIGLVRPAMDSCNEPYFEILPSSNSLPTYTELVELSATESLSVNLSTAPWVKDTFLGLWITREIKKNLQLSNQFECEECNTLYMNFKENKFDEEEKEVIKIVFDYN